MLHFFVDMNGPNGLLMHHARYMDLGGRQLCVSLASVIREMVLRDAAEESNCRLSVNEGKKKRLAVSDERKTDSASASAT